MFSFTVFTNGKYRAFEKKLERAWIWIYDFWLSKLAVAALVSLLNCFHQINLDAEVIIKIDRRSIWSGQQLTSFLQLLLQANIKY